MYVVMVLAKSCFLMLCRAVIDRDLMKKALIKEFGTFIKMSGFDTVTSIYVGGGE